MSSAAVVRKRGKERDWSMQVIALFDYEPEQSDELGFREGDVLRVLYVQDDGWWAGYNVDNVDIVGLFPSNYVQAQRVPILPQPKTAVVDAATTPRPPASSRQRIQQERRAIEPPELDNEEDEVPELRSEYRGHIGTVHQLRKNLQEAELASEAVRDARRQAEREQMRHSKRWRHERGQNNDDEEDEEEFDATEQRRGRQMFSHQRKAQAANEVDNEGDDDDSAYPHQQGYMHENGQQEVEEDSSPNDNNYMAQEKNGQAQSTIAGAHIAAATVIARGYRHHFAIVQRNREQEQRKKQLRLKLAVAVAIQRWRARHSMQREHRQCETEKNNARLVWKRQNQAARDIQKWIRLRWACFWRRRRQVEREKQTQERKELEESKHRQAELEEQQRRQTELEEAQSCQVQEEEIRQRIQRHVEEGKQRHQLEQEQEDGEAEGENDSMAPSPSPQSQSPDKPRRKVMKKEAVHLIKALVNQQLDETLRDHDAKMDELQRMVAKLQTVVRKQTAMLKDSTDQLVNLKTTQQDKQLPVPPRNNEVTSGSLLPQIQSSIPRHPVAPSGLRAPRPVMTSKLPLLGNGRQGNSDQCSMKRK